METSPKFTVYYIIGGYENFVARKLHNGYTESLANEMVADLNKMGYPAMKIEVSKASFIGGMCSYNEFETPTARRKYWEECHLNYLSV